MSSRVMPAGATLAQYTWAAGSPSSRWTCPPSLLVTTIASPLFDQPWAIPVPIGDDDPSATPTTASERISTPAPVPWNCLVEEYVNRSAEQPPTSGTAAPRIE